MFLNQLFPSHNHLEGTLGWEIKTPKKIVLFAENFLDSTTHLVLVRLASHITSILDNNVNVWDTEWSNLNNIMLNCHNKLIPSVPRMDIFFKSSPDIFLKWPRNKNILCPKFFKFGWSNKHILIYLFLYGVTTYLQNIFKFYKDHQLVELLFNMFWVEIKYL